MRDVGLADDDFPKSLCYCQDHADCVLTVGMRAVRGTKWYVYTQTTMIREMVMNLD